MKKDRYKTKMKLLLALIALLVFAAGCGQQKEPTLQEVAQANDIDRLMQTHENVRVRITYVNAEPAEYIYYSDGVSDYDMQNGLLWSRSAPQAVYCFRDGVGQVTLNCAGAEPFAFVRTDGGVEEKVESVEERDGKIYFTTAIAATSEFAARYYYDYVEGDEILFQYVLEADTLRMTEGEATVHHPDGTKEVVVRMEITVDVEVPEELPELRARAEDASAWQVEVVLDAGTEQEQRYSAAVCPGDALRVLLPDGYDRLYTDPEYTEIWGDAGYAFSPTQAMTLYSRAGGPAEK